MKNSQSFFLFKSTMFVLFSLLLSETSNAQFNDPALFVVADAENLNAAEIKIDSVLEDMGFDVTAVGQDAVTDADTYEMSLVLISATVSSSTIATNMPGLPDMEIPLVNWEPFLYDHLGHSELDGGEFNSADIKIVSEGHPLAADLPNGVTTISTIIEGVSYGVPVGDAEIIAVNPDDETQAVIFAYDQGAQMFSRPAPARRVGTFLLNAIAATMTDEGWTLFKAQIKWAMNYVDPTAVDDLKMDTPREFILYKNYPNPFDQVTYIKFSIPIQTKVQLCVCDVLGKKIATLVDEIRPAGNNTVSFNASEMSSGVYYYRLICGSNVKTKAMLLMK